jgi:hypothetical protein
MIDILTAFLVLMCANPVVEHHTLQLGILGVSFDACVPLSLDLILEGHQPFLVDIIGTIKTQTVRLIINEIVF